MRRPVDPWEVPRYFGGDLKRELCHPLAGFRMSEDWFWDISDDDSPFGNWSGWQVLRSYHHALLSHGDVDGIDFLEWFVDSRSIKSEGFDWNAADEDEAVRLLEQDERGFFGRDHAVIAMAFAQIVLLGRVDAPVKELAQCALRRQSFPAIIQEWADPKERAERVARMQEVLTGC